MHAFPRRAGFLLMALMVLSASPALAKHRHHGHHYIAVRHETGRLVPNNDGRLVWRPSTGDKMPRIARQEASHGPFHSLVDYSARRHDFGYDPRPSAWCGWQMRHWLGVVTKEANRALWWAHYGTNARGPAVGVVVVWAHGRSHGHVGIIVGRTESGQFLVKSGNDDHAVRTRIRNVRNAVAFRWPA